MRDVWLVIVVLALLIVLYFLYAKPVKADDFSCRGEIVSSVSITGASTLHEEDYRS